ncbi:hypothetical protein D3C73_1236920 [compost metagenome]
MRVPIEQPHQQYQRPGGGDLAALIAGKRVVPASGKQLHRLLLRQVEFAADTFHLRADHLAAGDDQFITCNRIALCGVAIEDGIPAFLAFPTTQVVQPTLHAFDALDDCATLEACHPLRRSAGIALLCVHVFFSLKETTGALPFKR